MIIACFVFALTYGQTGQWINAGDLQEGINGAEAFVSYPRIYIVGGYSDSMQATVNWIRSYSRSQNKVTTIAYMLRKRKNFVAAVQDSLCYFVGGEEGIPVTGNGSIELKNTFIYLPTLIDSGLYFNRSNGIGAMVNRQLHMVGGGPEGVVTSLSNPYSFEYNPVSKVFGFLQDSTFSPTSPQEGQQCVVVGNYIYIFGGINNTVLSDIYRYNTVDHSFQKLNISLLHPRANGKAVYDSTYRKIYVFGGFNEGSAALTSGEVYSVADSDLNFLQTMPPLNHARKNFMSIMDGPNIYAFGGIDELGHTLKQVEILNTIEVSNVAGGTVLASEGYKLIQNYPNPFNPSTIIPYMLREKSVVSLNVLDVLGREVCRLVQAEQSAGKHSAVFDAKQLPSGVYLCQLRVCSASAGVQYLDSKKMLLVR